MSRLWLAIMERKQKVEESIVKKKIAIRIVGVGLILAIALAMGGCGNGSKVATDTVVSGSVEQKVEVDGHIETEEETAYYAEVSGQIQNFTYHSGDLIPAGTQLYTYDTTDFEHAVEQASLQAEAARSGYQGTAAQSARVNQAYRDASEKEASYKELYTNIQKNVNELQSNLQIVADTVEDEGQKLQVQLAQTQVEMAQAYAAAYGCDLGSDSYKGYMQTYYDLQTKQAKLQKQVAQLPDPGAKPDEIRYLAEAASMLAELTTQRSMLSQKMLSTEFAGMTSGQLIQLEKQAELAELAADWSQEELEKAQKGGKAEKEGILSEVAIEDGSYVAEGTRLFTLKNPEKLKAVVEVTGYEGAQMKEGQSAIVTVSGKTYEGTVSKIRREAVTDSQNKAKLQVEIHIENPAQYEDTLLYLGSDVDACILTQESVDSLMVSNLALYADDAGDYVYLINNGVVEKRYVETGASDSSYTAILSGLEDGEQVITDAMTDAGIGTSVQAK